MKAQDGRTLNLIAKIETKGNNINPVFIVTAPRPQPSQPGEEFLSDIYVLIIVEMVCTYLFVFQL